MAEPDKVEYFVLLYVPNVVSDRSIPLAVIFTDPSNVQEGICAMRVAAAWQTTVRLVDPYSDVQMIEALLSEIRDRLLSKLLHSDMIRQLEDSFSNLVQVSERRKFPGRFSPESCEDLVHELLRDTLSKPRCFSSTPSAANLVEV